MPTFHSIAQTVIAAAPGISGKKGATLSNLQNLTTTASGKAPPLSIIGPAVSLHVKSMTHCAKILFKVRSANGIFLYF